MNLIVYSDEACGPGNRLMDAALSQVAGVRIEQFYSIADLAKRLIRGKRSVSVVILCAGTRERLSEILGIRNLLRDLRTIIILPDRKSDTLAQGLVLRPSFFSFVDSDFKDVSTVLTKMISFYGKDTKGF